MFKPNPYGMIGRLLRRYMRAQRGATAVELALVAGPFLYVLGCIIETGLMLFTEYTLQSSVQEAARQVRTGQAQAAAMTQGQLKSVVCDMAGIVVDCTHKVSVYVNSATNFTTLKSSLPSMLTVGPSVGGSVSSSSYKCGSPSQAVAIVATYDWHFVLPFMSFFSNMSDDSMRRLVGFAMFQNEPFPAGSSCA